MTSLIKRSIRLKEFQPNIEKQHLPSVSYLSKVSQIKDNQAFFQRTDKHGFTTNHISFSSSERVVLIGDSFIENIFVDESKRITSRVEEFFLVKGKRVEVLNAGVSGATGLGLLNCILNKIIFLKPEVIIFTQPSCDFSALLYENGYFNDSMFFSNIIPSGNINKQEHETIEKNLKQILLVIELITKACQIYDIKICFATCCSNSSKRQLKMMNDVIRDNQYLGYDVIDLDQKIPKNEVYFYDKQHLNEKGSDYIANIFFDYIENNISLNENCTFNKRSIGFKSLECYPSIIESLECSIEYNNSITSVSFKLKNNGSFDVTLGLFYLDTDDSIIDYKKKRFVLKAGYDLEVSYPVSHLKENTTFRFISDNNSLEFIEVLYFFTHSVM